MISSSMVGSLLTPIFGNIRSVDIFARTRALSETGVPGVGLRGNFLADKSP